MEFLLPILISFLITVLLIPPVRAFAAKFNLLDSPKIRPHPAHTQIRIVPRAGGLALFGAIAICILIFIPFSKTTAGILVALCILLIIGLLDDKYHNLSPYIRLLIQFAAVIIAVASGIGINFITNPLGGIIHFDNLYFLPQFLSVIWIVWVMNMINWSKGVDGQMPGIIFIAALILGLLSFKMALFDSAQINIVKLSFITAGAAFGFLIFNWYPAKIFPGFSGSTILGFMIAILSILSGGKLATAGLVLLIPATDFAYTFFRRIFSGKSPVWGDRQHLHHKLLDLGMSHQQISLFYILGSAILGAAALSLSSQGKLFAGILVSTIILGGILWLNFFGVLSKRHAPDNG